MWLLPLRLSLSVPESEDLILPARESLVFGLWVTSSGTPMLRPFSWRGWKTRPWSQRLFGAALSNTWMPAYMRGWILSRQAFPASPSPSPVLDEARTTTAGSGPQSPGSFAWYDRASSSWRTSLPLFGMDLIPSSQIWPNSGSMRNGICFERPRRERLTVESDSSSSQWGTATAHERTQTPRDVDHGEQLANQAAMWGTPRVTTNNMAGNPERKDGHHSRIEDQAAMWATPNAHDGRRPEDPNSTQGANLARDATLWPTPQAHDAIQGKTPEQVEEMRRRTGAGVSNLNEVASMWPTPRAADFEATGPHRGTPDTLPSAVENWPTPQASDALGEMHQSEKAKAKGWAPRLQDEARAWPTPEAKNTVGYQVSSGKRYPRLGVVACGPQDQATQKDGDDGSKRAVLNPQFVETLMGLPIGWTDCDAWAMRWSPPKPHSLSENS